MSQSWDPSSHDRIRSPTPLSQWPTKAQATANKGKKPIYPHLTWVRGRDASPTSLDSNASSPGKLSLLARISSPSSNGLEEDARASGSGDVEGADARGQREVEEIGEVSQVAGENLQDELPAQTITAGVQIKAEETAFGEPTVPLLTERRNSITVVPKEEEMPVDFSSNGIIDVDAFLATVSPTKHKPQLVTSPPRMFPVPSSATNQTPPHVTKVVRTSPVLASRTKSTPSLQPSPYPQAVLDQCRNILVPLVERNAKLRKPGVDEEVVKRRAFGLLSDKLCADFIKLAKQVREQISVQAPPPRTPSTDDVQGQKRGRGESYDSPGPPRKVVKVESPKKVVFDDDDIVLTMPPSAPAPVAPAEDIQMDEGIENISLGHPSEPLVSGTGVDVTFPPSSREPSAALPGPGSGANRHLNISSTEREARTGTDMPLPPQENAPASSSSHVGSGSPSVHATVAARDEEDGASPSLPAPTPSNIEPGSVAFPASRPSSRSPSPYANASTTDVAADIGTTTHESDLDHAASDTSRHDAESVARILNAASEDEQVAHAPVDDMRHEQSADIPKPPVYPPCLVPGVWQAVMGQPSARIETIDFFVDDATADAIDRWSRRHESFSLNERHVVIRLLCVPHTAVEAILQDTGLSPEAIANDLFDSEPDWPSSGQLVVELNSKPDSHGNAWFVQSPVSTKSLLPRNSHAHDSLNADSMGHAPGHHVVRPARS
ncbi:hypothetical protein LXA43DRAFT_1057289 [Ganoderma leucocontextum]|nr:hypothetical protein LXA43DRAFT_1057289 [Ganoderma leucocontextum]